VVRTIDLLDVEIDFKKVSDLVVSQGY